MTPKEKAIELYQKYELLGRDFTRGVSMKEYSKQGIEVTCPCYKEKKFLLPIKLQEDNSFSCIECKKDFSVDVSVRSFLQTDPIDIEKADAAFIEVVNKIKNS